MGLLDRLLGRKGQERDDSRVTEPRTSPQPATKRIDWSEPHPGTPRQSVYVPRDDNPGRFVGPGGLPALHLVLYRSEVPVEVVLRLCEISTGLLVGPTDTRLVRAGILVSSLRGEKYHQDGCRLGDFSPGTPVRLVPEPDNPYDNRAVAVYDASGRHMCAYVNKQKARAYLKRRSAGEDMVAISLRGTAAGRKCDQVTVLIATPQVIASLRDGTRHPGCRWQSL